MERDLNREIGEASADSVSVYRGAELKSIAVNLPVDLRSEPRLWS